VPPRHKALLEASIDAGLQSVPWNYVAEDAGMNNLGDVIDYVPDWQFVSVNASDQWASAHRETVVRLLRAIQRGTDWLYANRVAAARIAARELPAPLHHAERAWDYFTSTNALTRDMSINLVGLAKVIAVLCEAGLLQAAAPAEPSFYFNDRYWRAARGE
jgi:ABC-type nitrate/sulfonate/bicarbonate transport system substrate-binding protein